MTRRLALVRHSISKADFDVPPSEWGLTDEGRSLCQDVAEELKTFSVSRIFTSKEPKALQTAEEIARSLSLPVQIARDIHEHERPRLPYYGATEWHRLIQEMFARPDALVLGHETANQAKARFVDAVGELAHETPDDDLIVVTHGTVMSLYLSSVVSTDPFTIWSTLKMPDVRTVNLDATG